jgi:hypothetical protein
VRLLVIAGLLACGASEPPVCDGPLLFGAPSPSTGLTDAECAPVCEDCGGEPWGPPTYTADDFATWRSFVLDDPPAPPIDDPYADPPSYDDGPDTVCAVHFEGDGHYRLETWESSSQAQRKGGQPTHFGRCGVCSSLADLAVYAEQPELSEPVRACGLDHLTSPAEEHVACLEALGFTTPCAWIWYHNTVNTRVECAAECLAALDAPWNEPDGSLNPCLQCDEDESGPVFQAVAGRTRRNTGLASTICRPCSEVRPLEHHYAP